MPRFLAALSATAVGDVVDVRVHDDAVYASAAPDYGGLSGAGWHDARLPNEARHLWTRASHLHHTGGDAAHV